MNSVQYGAFGPGADVPPELVPRRPPRFGSRLVVGRRYGAPDVRAADQGRFDLFGQHAIDVGCPAFEFGEAVADELIVLRIWFVEPVHKGLVQPTLFSQVGFAVAPDTPSSLPDIAACLSA